MLTLFLNSTTNTTMPSKSLRSIEEAEDSLNQPSPIICPPQPALCHHHHDPISPIQPIRLFEYSTPIRDSSSLPDLSVMDSFLSPIAERTRSKIKKFVSFKMEEV